MGDFIATWNNLHGIRTKPYITGILIGFLMSGLLLIGHEDTANIFLQTILSNPIRILFFLLLVSLLFVSGFLIATRKISTVPVPVKYLAKISIDLFYLSIGGLIPLFIFFLCKTLGNVNAYAALAMVVFLAIVTLFCAIASIVTAVHVAENSVSLVRNWRESSRIKKIFISILSLIVISLIIVSGYWRRN